MRTAHSLCVVSEISLAVALIGVLIKESEHLKNLAMEAEPNWEQL